MLILTRRIGETMMVGDDVKVTVLGVTGNQVRIGVNAPKDVAVHREEIFARIQKEREEVERTQVFDITGTISKDNLVSETIAATDKGQATTLFMQMHPKANPDYLEYSCLWHPAGLALEETNRLDEAEAQILQRLKNCIRYGDRLPFVFKAPTMEQAA